MKQTMQPSGLRMSSAATGPATTQVTLKNPGANPLPIELRLVGGRHRFSLGVKRTRRSLDPHGVMRVPVKFHTATPGHIFSRQATHRAMLQVIDQKSQHILQQLPITALGPVLAPIGMRPCLHTPKPPPPRRARITRDPAVDPPPTIERTSYRADTHCWANTGTVETWWRINNIEVAGDWVEIGSLEAGWGDGIPDAGGWGTHYSFPESLDHCEGGGEWTVDRTFGSDLRAGNVDGNADDIEWYYARHRVGYEHAAVPHDPMLTPEISSQVRQWLEDIDAWLRGGGLSDFIRYTEYWNANVLADPDWPDDLVFNGGVPPADAAYLRGAVGAGSLADDMLAAMQHVLIYTRAGHLPRTFRPGAHFDPDNSRLCDEAYGITYGLRDRPAGTYGDWIAVCYEISDDMTLTHELFHYAARENYGSDPRAFLISYLYTADTYGWKPDPSWPDWS